MPPLLLPAIVMMVLLILLILTIFFVFYFARKAARKLTKAVNVSRLPRSVARSLKEARRYGHLIIQMAQQYPSGPIRDRLNLTIEPVGKWLDNLSRLEQGLEKLYSQRNLARELRQTNFEIDDLRRQILTGADKKITVLRELMKSKEQHLAALKELQRFQTQAELKIHKIASDLGATHAEMLLLVAKGDFNENRLRRLDESLQEQVNSMRDVLAVMEESGYSRVAG